MQNFSILTLEEIKDVLEASFKVQQVQSNNIQARINLALGEKPKEPLPEIVALTESWLTQIPDMVAKRLIADDRSVNLLSAEDLVALLPQMYDLMEKTLGPLEPDERKMIDQLVKTLFKGLMDMVSASYPATFQDPYDYYSHFLKAVSQVASEHDIEPSDVPNSIETADEVTRRLLTKEQYVGQGKSTKDKILNMETILNSMLQPILDLMANQEDLDQQERDEVAISMKKEIMPQLEEHLVVALRVFDDYLDEETARIYQ